MRLRRILAVFGFATGLMLAAAAPASASLPTYIFYAPDGTAYTCTNAVVSPDGGATACFEPTGEHLGICDSAADGHHPGIWYIIDSGSVRENDYSIGHYYCIDINLDLPETSTVTYRACNYEGSTAISCSNYVTVSAKG
jgi:hypothetical protein